MLSYTQSVKALIKAPLQIMKVSLELKYFLLQRRHSSGLILFLARLELDSSCAFAFVRKWQQSQRLSATLNYRRWGKFRC